MSFESTIIISPEICSRYIDFKYLLKLRNIRMKESHAIDLNSVIEEIENRIISLENKFLFENVGTYPSYSSTIKKCKGIEDAEFHGMELVGDELFISTWGDE